MNCLKRFKIEIQLKHKQSNDCWQMIKKIMQCTYSENKIHTNWTYSTQKYQDQNS